MTQSWRVLFEFDAWTESSEPLPPPVTVVRTTLMAPTQTHFAHRCNGAKFPVDFCWMNIECAPNGWRFAACPVHREVVFYGEGQDGQDVQALAAYAFRVLYAGQLDSIVTVETPTGPRPLWRDSADERGARPPVSHLVISDVGRLRALCWPSLILVPDHHVFTPNRPCPRCTELLMAHRVATGQVDPSCDWLDPATAFEEGR